MKDGSWPRAVRPPRRTYSSVRANLQSFAEADDQRFTTSNWLAGLTKWPRTAGLPMFGVMVADTLCTPTVENVTVKTPVPAMRPKLTRKVLGEIVAPGSVEFKMT